jgi:hypothetical protein
LDGAYEDYNCSGDVSFFRHVEGLKMEQRAVIKFCVKLKKTATETFEMLKSAHIEECLSGQVCLNDIKGSEKGECRYKTMNRKAILQLPEQKDRWKSFKSVWPKIKLLVFGC